ncbi:MAG: response regulator transcription factor [Chlorobi bacterium]|nr:response regulator transcription factor [Chlorobiota bacterium]
MIKAIIIEDEEKIRAGLKKMLALTTPFVEIQAETAYVSEAVELIRKHSPDLIFLDIELEDGSGFDLLNSLDNYDFQIIFITAYNQHAIKAFKYSALDYLLKPVDPAELKSAVEKARQKINQTVKYKELLEVLKNNWQYKYKKIVLKTAYKHYIVDINDIIRLEADGAYTTFVTVDDKILISRNLKYYQNLLGHDFFRCHQSHLINRKYINGLDSKDMLHLKNNELIPVSKRMKQKLLQWLQ